MRSPFPYRFIAIEGNIGAGKTTLSTMLAEDFNGHLILEQFADNPFLPYFYRDPDRYAFSVELFFMTERHKQLQKILTQPDMFKEFIISDYFFIKTLLFAKNNLHAEEYRLFQRLFQILNSSFPNPDILVYLHRSVEKLMETIRTRGREYERDISYDYLRKIQNAYFDYFRKHYSTPVLVINVENFDYLHNTEDYEKLIDCLKRKYQPGFHQISFS